MKDEAIDVESLEFGASYIIIASIIWRTFAVSSVSADGLAPWGAEASADTVITKIGSCIRN